MISVEKPHRRTHASHGVVFWKGNAAASEDDADRAVVYLGPPSSSYPEFEFNWPGQKYEVEKLERALGEAFNKGIAAGKKEVRDALGAAGW